MARDGATPTIFGPSPLNKAREPSVLTMYLELNGNVICREKFDSDTIP